MRRVMTLAMYAVFVLTLISFPAPPGLAGDEGSPSPLDKVKWQKGPCTADLGKFAEVRVPAGCVFAGSGDVKTILESMQNFPSGDEVGFIMEPSSETALIFRFDESGYVKDDEKGSLDADAMLNSIKSGTEKANEERRKRGWSEMQVVGWEIPPNYNENTHNLEWAVRGKSKEGEVVNFNTRLLGRDGFMKVTLVTTPEDFKDSLTMFRNVVSDFSYKPGHRYAEFRQGDKVAKYGLTALVVGGAAAAAAKAGVFKGLWKLIVAAGAGLLIAFKKLFGKQEAA